MISRETAERVLEAARIEEVVGDFVTLRRRGAEFWACCPFHDEKSPSFHVVPAKGIYKCFGCGKSGSAVGFVMEYDHVTYWEAIRYLAKKYNIELHEQEQDPGEAALRRREESLMAASDFAFRFFQDQLRTPEGKALAVQYFHGRGLDDKTIAQYGLGWAPRSRVALRDAALGAGYKAEYLVETGLCAEWEDHSLHDRFFERVMFPIHSVSGRVIAFGGRTLLAAKSDKVAKYVNSKESAIYVKSNSLYGIWFAKTDIARQDRCYLVEGYLDVLSMHQAGVLNCVASSGTSLTQEQVRLMGRFTKNITIVYDGDSAGQHATVRALDLILHEGMNPRVVFLPDGDDPDSFARKHDAAQIRDFLAREEKDGLAFKADLALSGEAGNDPTRRAEAINELADTVAQVPDAVKRQAYIDWLSQRLAMDADIIAQRIQKTRLQLRREERPLPVASREAVRPASVPQGEEGGVEAPSERELLTFLLRHGTTPLQFATDSEFHNPEGVQQVAQFIDEALSTDGAEFATPAYRDTYKAYFQLYRQGLGQEDIVRTLLNGEDRTVADVVARLHTQKYALTVHNLADSMTTEDSWLVHNVPRAILAYHDKRLSARYRQTAEKLSTAAPEEVPGFYGQLRKIDEIRKTINIKLGRLKA